jgi:hypothetical protein
VSIPKLMVMARHSKRAVNFFIGFTLLCVGTSGFLQRFLGFIIAGFFLKSRANWLQFLDFFAFL